MCKKLNKLEDVRIFKLIKQLNHTKQSISVDDDLFAFNKVVP